MSDKNTVAGIDGKVTGSEVSLALGGAHAEWLFGACRTDPAPAGSMPWRRP